MAGRPSYKPTAAMRQKVAIAAGGGMSHESLALALGISRNTLEKHFERELSVGAFQKRLEVLLAMHAAAKKGNVAAAKVYAAFEPQYAVPPLPKGPETGETAEPVAAPVATRLGKKEQAQADAATAAAGTDWAGLMKPAAPLQ